MKGGAAGGGFAQVLPMENINLHFTGDFMPLPQHIIPSRHCWITIYTGYSTVVMRSGMHFGSVYWM